MAAVVTDVAQADKGYGVWEGDAGVAVNISVAELCDEGDEDGFGESVGFVEEDDQGAVKMSAEAGEGTLEDVSVAVEVGVLEEGFAVWDIGVFHGIIHGMEEVVGAVFGVGEIAEDFEGAVEGMVTAGGVELAGELLYARRFTGLSCGVDEEVLLAVDEALEFGEACGGR
jgi:hypothetical protein